MIKTIMVLIFLIFSATPVFALDFTIVTENAAPYNYEKDGEVKGVSTEILRAVLKELGIESPSIIVLPWARAYKMALEEENVLIYSITRLASREELFKWVGTIFPVKVSFYKIKKRTDIQISSLEEARQYTVGGTRKDAKLQYLESKGFQITEIVEQDERNLKKLKAGRIDLAPFEDLRLSLVVKDIEGVEFSDFEKAYPIRELSTGMYMAFSLKTPDSLVNDFKKALEKIKADGTYANILKNYAP